MFDEKSAVFGNWHIEENLGSGAFGTVYKIKKEDFSGTQYAALKVIKIPNDKMDIDEIAQQLSEGQTVNQFFSSFIEDCKREINAMYDLKGHSNIVSIDDCASIPNDDGVGATILIKMELLKPFNKNQADVIRNQNDILKLGIDICNALISCDKHQIIHRDIKPANIFISNEGNFKLGDFGISRKLDGTSSNLSQKGTPNYMAPEICLLKPYNKTVDIYSTGILLYQLLNHNRLPFYPDYPAQIYSRDCSDAIAKRMSGAPIPPIKGVSADLNYIVLKACEFNPRNRYQSAKAMQADLNAVLSGKPLPSRRGAQPPVRPVPQPPRPPVPQPPKPDNTPEKKSGSKAKSVLVALVIIALLAGVAFCGVKIIGDRQKGEDNSSVTSSVTRSETTSATTKAETTQSTTEAETSQSTTTTETTQPATEAQEVSYKIGDYINFGIYEQDGKTFTGGELIEWKVIDKTSDGKLFVVSRYALDVKPYNTSEADVTWETCSLRNWLNNNFYNEAFSSEEQSKICTTNVVTADNFENGTDGGNDTEDKLFLLSTEEVRMYFSDDESRKCVATDAVDSQAWHWTESDDTADNQIYDRTFLEGKSTCYWWLRSPGNKQSTAADVFYTGIVKENGGRVNATGAGVRPAMWIKL